MGRMRQADEDGLYEGVMERLALALEAAERDGKEPVDLEVQGLSDGELAFIRAYLQRDAHWLSGWHAAAQEQARLARRSRRILPRGQCGDGARDPGKPLAIALDCALCGTTVRWPNQPGLVVCATCGSQLMKAFRRVDSDVSG